MARINNLYYVQKDFELAIPSWEFSDEGVSCILGPSGSGKSTLLWLLAGLLKPSLRDGLPFELWVGKENLAQKINPHRGVHLVFQDHGLFPHLTVWENIIFPAEGSGLSKKDFWPQAEELVNELGLTSIKNSLGGNISGGEAQRASLARALVVKPKLVLLDEPFSSLDEGMKSQARDVVKKLNLRYQVPFLLVTHDPRDVEFFSGPQLKLS